jgi:two-component system, chemotaxis family, sensor kinase CheA
VIDLAAKLLAAFQVEHKEHLEAVRALLEDLARKEFDTADFDFVEAFRRVHTLKGASRAVGLRPIETLVHQLETLMSRCQAGTLALDREVVAVIHLALDGVEDFMAALEKTADPPPPHEALAAVESLLGIAPAQLSGEPRGEEAAHAGGAAVTQGAATARATARVDVDSLDVVLKHAGEILAENQLHERIESELRRLRNDLAALARDDGALDAILDQARAVGRLQHDAVWRLRKLGRQLYGDVRKLRIVPAESAFGGMRKMTRDLARAEGKQIEVVVEGLDTRADRQVLQVLKEPVMHLLRNAVSHGIETPDVRTTRGKPAIGRVRVAVRTQRNRLLVRVEDDGMGLDRTRIIKEAFSRGLLPENMPAPDTIEQLAGILLQPGFTTADAVSELAGRGIGLSVVDQAVRQLQGSFRLSAGEPAGTVATISVPLAVASSRLLLVQCQQQVYGIPADHIERLSRLATAAIITVNGEPMMPLEGEGDPVPLASLAQLLGEGDAAPAGDSIPVMMLKVDTTRIAVAVDAFVAVQDSVIHDLEPAYPGHGLIMGGLIAADGSVSTVVSPAALVRAARERKRAWTAPRLPAAAAVAPTILVVDDSVTTRTLEKSILEAKGFRVRLSVDGLDALEQLRQRPVDLVIVDIEMPRMDGFELLHAMKNDQRLAAIPVVLVTSRDSAQDKRKGLALGAEAYIIKQRFDQRELLETIDQIL